MQTLTIDIINNQAIKLIQDMELKKLIRVRKEKPSFMCSEDELRESVRQQIDDMKMGKIKFIPHEQLKRKVIQ